MRLHLAVAVLGIALIANAVPVCFPRDESLNLTPTTVSFNGQPVTRSATTGRYTTDAGFEFDHGFAVVSAISDGGAACGALAGAVTLELADPFTGERRTIGMVVTP